MLCLGVDTGGSVLLITGTAEIVVVCDCMQQTFTLCIKIKDKQTTKLN